MSNDNFSYPEGLEIYWEPWIDAYSNEDFAKMENLMEELKAPIDSEIEEELTQEEIDLINEMANQDVFNKPMQTIMTPFGVMPITENTLASTRFKFWTGHTNFKLQKYHLDILDNECIGVESVDILTPLRFKISIGKLFRDREVMFEVREKLVMETARRNLERLNHEIDSEGGINEPEE